jgi:ankyrin repeat protein
MNVQLARFLWLTAAIVFVWVITRPQKRRRWRVGLLAIIGVAWLVSAGFLMTAMLKKKPFFDAVESGVLRRVEESLSNRAAIVHSRTLWGDTALHLAVRSGESNMVTLLLEAGADVNAKGDSGVTALHLAAFNGNMQIAEALLKAGSEVNAVGFRHNDTPLHVAALHGHANVVKLLLAYGADANAENMLHKTPLQLAQENQQTNVIAVLTNPPSPKQ